MFSYFLYSHKQREFCWGGGKREVVGVHEEGGGMRREVDEKWGGMFGGNINTWI